MMASLAAVLSPTSVTSNKKPSLPRSSKAPHRPSMKPLLTDIRLATHCHNNGSNALDWIVSLLRYNCLAEVVELASEVRRFGLCPASLFHELALEALRLECRRLLNDERLEQFVELMETLAGVGFNVNVYQFTIKDIVDPEHGSSKIIQRCDPELAVSMQLLKNMKHSRCDLDVITYNGMVSSLSGYNLFHKAIILELVNARSKPNVVAIASVLLTISGLQLSSRFKFLSLLFAVPIVTLLALGLLYFGFPTFYQATNYSPSVLRAGSIKFKADQDESSPMLPCLQHRMLHKDARVIAAEGGKMKTTKGGKVMNPTDAYRKEIRKEVKWIFFSALWMMVFYVDASLLSVIKDSYTVIKLLPKYNLHKPSSDLIEASGGQALTYGGDVSKEEDVESMVKTAVDAWGSVDILVNNAVVWNYTYVHLVLLHAFSYLIIFQSFMMNTYFTMMAFLLQAAAKIMMKKKKFTNLKYSRVEIDAVRFEWAECMLDYI
ncbi:hypothetical protein ZIOFF_017899 [Zingiber officinale]|uniref:3-oxoacyl-[acyl-carrier-protein] reductase n=1 Tax=Zingiber officinale TaxID=94328 RepID=A0A8J5HFR2_ZINOF|nr:hypothetical protein ZIOFF_017899 [Zingiber officinale]